MTPTDRRYTREHEWAQVQGDTATIGITEYAQHQLGDVVYVELPKVGAKLSAMRPFGNVDSHKASSELFSPVSGEVTAVNTDLDATPEFVNHDPYRKGWIIKARLSNAAEVDSLMSAEEYDRFLEGQPH